nr:hypothetical protein [Tanacetum cinerariifolium]
MERGFLDSGDKKKKKEGISSTPSDEFLVLSGIAKNVKNIVTPPKMRVAAEYCTGALLHNTTALVTKNREPPLAVDHRKQTPLSLLRLLSWRWCFGGLAGSSGVLLGGGGVAARVVTVVLVSAILDDFHQMMLMDWGGDVDGGGGFGGVAGGGVGGA